MKIITVNLPESYIKAIDNLIGDEMSFPSRSELVRVAVREFLIRELNNAMTYTETVQIDKPNTSARVVKKSDEMFIQIPITSNLNEPVQYKRFRIVQK